MKSPQETGISRGKRVLLGVVLVAASFVFFYLLFFDPWGLHPVDGWLQARLDYHAGDMEMAPAETEGQLWTCSMHPHILEDEPGECPVCGMTGAGGGGGACEAGGEGRRSSSTAIR